MNYRHLFYTAIAVPVLLASCSKSGSELTPSASFSTQPTASISGATVLGAPVAEEKVYKLLKGYDSDDDFEASGVQYHDGYFYVVFDNTQKVAKIKSTLPVNSNDNSLISTSTPGSGDSNFEGITFDDHNTENFYIVEETAEHGNDYQPRIYEYNTSLSYQDRMWADYDFSSSNQNKGFEGIAWLRRNGENYMLGLVEGTGKVVVLEKTSSEWEYVTEITLPSSVTFSDYSDMALHGNTIAITSQEDGQLWIGTLSSTSWAITGGTAYSFPLGDNNGNIGMGSLPLYGNVEGVSFISSSQIVICSDRTKSSQPAYQEYKEMTVSVFNLP